MKGLLKLSTVALSAAMVAGMSTPVFAAGASVSETTTAKVPTIQVVDANNNVVATTNTDIKKTYKYDGTANDANDDPTETTVNLKEGSVKNLTATASDGSEVKWAYDTEATNLADAKKYVTLDNGKITVAKGADKATTKDYKLLAYTDESVDKSKDAKEGALKENSFVEVTVHVVAANAEDHKPTISYVNGDSTYVNGDFDNIDLYATNDPSVNGEETLPKVTHSSAAEMKDASKEINHVATGSSAAFTINSGDDADYNTLVTCDDVPGLTVKTTSNKMEGTVSVTGNIVNRFGVTKFAVKVAGKETAPLYVIADATSDVNVYRVYNPNTGEHFYTTSAEEADTLDKIGWDLEAIGWVAPSTGDDVYRLYNPNSGEHHYTTSAKERDALKVAGWNYEGVAFQSASKDYTPIYREYNKNALAFNHNYTANKGENDELVNKFGWKYEGIAFYALSSENTDYSAAAAADAARKDVDAALNA